jgi:hypothetical protein
VGGDRARVAVYAATQASRHVPPSRLAGQLRAVLDAPDAKVTSRKEAVRLAAVRLPVPSAAELLTRTYARPGTHLDVRAACVAFAGPLLAEEPVWGMLADAAGAEPVLRAAVLRVAPLDLPEPYRERYARLVRAVCDTDDPETAAPAFAALARWAPWSPDAPVVLADAVADLSERAVWRSAADGLVTAAGGSPAGTEGLLRALRALADAEDRVDARDVPGTGREPEGTGGLTAPEGGPEDGLEDALEGAPGDAFADAGELRDRPARRRVQTLVAGLAQEARSAPDRIRPAALAASDLLAGYDAFVAQAAEIAACHLDPDAEPERFDRLAALTEGRPALAARTARRVRDRLRRPAGEGDPETLLDTARRLARHGGHAQGLLAVALTDVVGIRTDWPAPWRDLVRALRRHPVPDVRDAALARVTAHE